MNIVHYLLIFISVSVGAMGLMIFFAPGRAGKRMREVAGAEGKNDWIKTAVDVVGPFAALSTPEGKWETSPLRIRFMNAGIRHPHAPLIFFGAKTLLPLLFGLLSYLAIKFGGIALERNEMLFVVLASATVGCFLPNLIVKRIIAHRKREIFENFPDGADLMLVCVEAGLGLDSALTRVAGEMRMKSVVLAQEIHLTNLEIRAGISRSHALRNLGTRTGVEELGSFSAMLIQADKFGTSVGESLRVFSEDLRHKRQINAETAAAKLPTKMLFPLVLCIFPAISLVVLGPAVINIWRTMAPMLAGQAVP